MRNFLVLTSACLFSLLATSGLSQELLIYNAAIHTVDKSMPKAEAMVIDEVGYIADIGKAEQLWTLYPDAIGLNLQGQLILPGFHDVHLHAIEAGITSDYCLLSQFASRQDYSAELSDCAAQWGSGSNTWVIGAGVNMTSLLDEVDDPLALIDRAIPNQPAIIIDDLGHGAWANSLALKQADLCGLKTNPNGGMLVRHEDDSLTGVVLESLSQTLVDAALPNTKENREWALESLEGALKTLAANGITSISDAGGYWPRGHDKVWQQAEALDMLTVRASNALYVYPEKDMESQIQALIDRRVSGTDKLARMDQVKIYVDGILSQGTGAVYEPYEAERQLFEATPTGFEYFPNGALNTYAKRLSDAGFQLHFHTTGDRGADLALDAIAQANPASGPHRITHLFLVDEASISRFAELNVVADFQLAPSALDAENEAYMREFIGDRADTLLPIRSMLDSGALVTLSSDWDADELNPLIKLQTVLTRGKQAVPDINTAIELMTLNPAKLLRHADRTGSLTKGKFADLVVINQDITKLAPERISKAKIIATLLHGEAVYDPEGWFDE